MEDAQLTLKAHNGIVYAYNDRVTISRKTVLGFMAQGIKGDRTIYYKDIKAIEYKSPTLITNGYLQFITNTELAVNQKTGIFGGMSNNASHDENAVTLFAMSKAERSKCDALYDFLQKCLACYKKDANSEISKTIDPADEIKKFKTLLDSGTITEAEFESKKKQLLGL